MKTRLDQLVVDLGLAPSRERARALILAGQVSVDGKPVTKAGTQVADDVAVALLAPDHPYVGRGGVKLAHALDAFRIAVAGREALDIGASTGGFTDVLLTRGAAHVHAVDVGRDQLHPRLRADPRVTSLEGVDIRRLAPASLEPLPSVVSIDVSFISLRLVLPAVWPLLAPGATLAALIKPQFEAGRERVGRGGIVRDGQVHAEVCALIRTLLEERGAAILGLIPSPVEGGDGNTEFLIGAKLP